MNYEKHQQLIKEIRFLAESGEIEMWKVIHDLLIENKEIAHIWGLSDVKDTAKLDYDLVLTDEQAWEILQQVDRSLDSEFGINWHTISTHIEMYAMDNNLKGYE